MMNKNNINVHQFRLLVIFCYIGTAVLIIPGAVADDSKQDAWIATIIGILLGLVLVWIFTKLGDRMNNMTIVEYSENVLGKWVGTFIALIFSIFLFMNSSTMIYILGNFLLTEIMPSTPIEVIVLVFIVVVIYASRHGIETIARTSEILFYLIAVIFLLFTLILIKDIDFVNIQPILEFGVRPISKSALLYTSYTSMTLVVFLMYYPASITKKEKKSAKKNFFYGAIIGSLILLIVVLLSVLILGPSATARSSFPVFNLARKASIGSALSRFESLITVLWFVTVFFKTTLYFHGSLIGIAQTLKLKCYKPLTIPMGTILFALTLMIFPSSVYASDWDSTTWVSVAITFCVLIPLLLLIVGKIRKIGKNDSLNNDTKK